VESGVAALARLLGAAGLGPDELRGDVSAGRVREAGDRLRELLARHGVTQHVALELERGRVELLVQTGRGLRTPVDRLPRSKRYRLTLDLRVADAREAGRGGTILLLDAPGR
jgi:hypothetical protein